VRAALWCGFVALCGCLEGSLDDADGDGGGDTSGGGTTSDGGGGQTGSPGGASGEGAAAGGGGGGEGGTALMGDPCQVDEREGVCVHFSECTLVGWAPVPGHCAGPAEIQCCAPLPARGMCDPEAMPLPNAGLDEAPGGSGCLPGMVRVEGFCVDRYEAFLVTFPALDPVSPYFNPGDASVMAMSAQGAVPQGYISEWQALDACVNAGKRLCDNAEWLRACRGPDTFTYPYGDELLVGTCNDHRDQHPAVEYFMSSEDWIWSELGHPCLNQLADGLAVAGNHPACTSAEGAFDLMGNLHEWTSDAAGTFRGGFYVDTSINGPGCLYATTAHDTGHWDYSTGFRCCADPS